jgi:hypothetical protein
MVVPFVLRTVFRRRWGESAWRRSRWRIGEAEIGIDARPAGSPPHNCWFFFEGG